MPPRRGIILVVEDDLALREFYRTNLAVAGFGVVAVEDGLDALRVIDRGTLPAAVVLDLILPRLSGRDVLEELRAHPATNSVPFIVVTAHDDLGLKLRKIDCLLRKPFTADALVTAVRKCAAQEVVVDRSG